MAVFRSDLDVVIFPSYIQGSEERLALELLEDMGDLGY
jgi:hypothetical protein